VPGKTRVVDAARILVVCALAGLGAYVAVRAWRLSFTHDESLSFILYVRESFSSILLSRGTDANNHPLNSAAMKLATDIFGPSEIALRAASVGAYAVYTASLVIVFRLVERRSIRFFGLAIAVGNPYVLDFFSLARGYGLALAFVSLSALFLLGHVDRPRPSFALAGGCCAALAVLANFATLTYFLVVPLVIVLPLVVPAPRGRRPVALGWLAAAVVLPTLGVVFLAGIPLLRLRSDGELYFGGNNGFWQDTAYGLISSMFYGHGWHVAEVALVVLVAITVLIGAVATVIVVHRRDLPLHAAAFVLLAGPGVASVVLHHSVGSLFLIERTALFFVPLFAIWLALAADAVARQPRFSTGVPVAAVVIGGAACVNMVAAANLSYVLDWRYDATTKEAISELAGPASSKRSVNFGVSYLFQPTTSFYRETRFRWLPECLPPDCLEKQSEYYYVTWDDVAEVRRRGARIIRVYPLSGGVLLRDFNTS
jgi:hypothetical protein